MKKPTSEAASPPPVAALLVGGLGTRLRPLTERVPKPLVEVGGKPFLDYLLERLAAEGIRDVVLLCSYKHELVEAHCGTGKRWGLRIRYSVEDEPRGTGGALVQARPQLEAAGAEGSRGGEAKKAGRPTGGRAAPLLVLNGDTFVDFDLAAFMAFHQETTARGGGLLTLLTMEGPLEARGSMRVDARGRVLEFLEKGRGGVGRFNTGAYLIEPAALDLLAAEVSAGRLGRKFSLETEGFPLLLKRRALHAFETRGRFVDMGTPQSLRGAAEVLNPKKS